jgi:serine protease
VVGFRSASNAALDAFIAAESGARLAATPESGVAVLELAARESLPGALARLRAQPDVAYAVPDYVAHASGFFIPNDRGRGRAATDWRLLQWNFLSADGVGAPVAWSNLRHDQAPGGRGVTVAILDTGVAYTNWRDPRSHQFFARSPDFATTHFSHPCDLIRGGFAGGPNATITSRSRCAYPQAVDRNGHGTFVAGVVAESTNNRIGVTGLAYGATIMPVRVLDAAGDGDATTIANGIRYAVTHGARIINLSLEFDLSVTAGDIPDVINAISFAKRHGVMVVAAAGNDSATQLAYPAADPNVVSVGATTKDRCVASYSNAGPGLSLVAPGGGDDSAVTGGPNCHPGRGLPDLYQMTLVDPATPSRFGLPDGWYGTSMAAPHVAAAAALVIASGVLGRRPPPARVLARLEATATPLGRSPRPNTTYGYGLLNAAAATAGPSRTAHHRSRKPAPSPHALA